jgi:uncharacterized protein (TIGR02757 family)
MRDSDLSRFLESAYERFHKRELVVHDPLIFLYDYPDLADRQIVGLVASCLAYGRVASILAGVRGVLERMRPSPWRYLADRSARGLASDFQGWRYRVTGGGDLAWMLTGVKRVIEDRGTLRPEVEPDDATILPAMERMVRAIGRAGEGDLRHLLPDPSRGSACKRLNLFFRWMVRRDAIDPGGWESIGAHRLIMPLDVHIHRVSRRLGLTRRRGANLQTARRITERLARICPRDPLRFDFCLTRPGIMGGRFDPAQGSGQATGQSGCGSLGT